MDEKERDKIIDGIFKMPNPEEEAKKDDEEPDKIENTSENENEISYQFF
jgi:hypothetical protein